jgi:hypothetical protein
VAGLHVCYALHSTMNWVARSLPDYVRKELLSSVAILMKADGSCLTCELCSALPFSSLTWLATQLYLQLQSVIVVV